MSHSQKVTFKNQQGQILVGYIDFYSKAHPHFALFAHCFTCSKDLKAIRTMAQQLAELGINVLRFDFTGLGNSEGSFEDTHFSSNIEDLVSACEYLAEHYNPPQLLIGHSLGGAAVLAAASKIPSAKAVVTIGAPSTPDHILKHFQGKEETILTEGYAQVSLGGRDFTIKKQLLEDLREFELNQTIKSLNKSLLIFHSPIDEVVPIEEAAKIYTQAMHPKSFISLDKADHLITNPQDAHYIAHAIKAWVGRYLEVEISEPSRPVSGEIIVQSMSTFEQRVITDHHQWVMDEPLKVGGDNSGPDPYEVLLGALGGCTNMTINMYAKFKGIQIDSLSTTLSHRRDHHKDCEGCENTLGALETITRTIHVRGPELDEQTLLKIHDIADKCPVHKTLSREAFIETFVEKITKE